MNLTRLIGDGCEEGLTTEAAFVDLSVGYDTVSHRILTRKLFEIKQDVRLTELTKNMLSDRRFLLTSSASAANGAGMLMAFHKAAPLTICCSTSTYIQMTSRHDADDDDDDDDDPNTRSFLYADGLCFATHKVEHTLGDALEGLTPHNAANHLRANPETTQIRTFHLNNREAQRELKVAWHGKLLAYSHKPVYWVARNITFQKLANTNWGTNARTIRTTALALCFSSAEYASLGWSRSSHASKIDAVLKAARRAISGCLRPTRVDDL